MLVAAAMLLKALVLKFNPLRHPQTQNLAQKYEVSFHFNVKLTRSCFSFDNGFTRLLTSRVKRDTRLVSMFSAVLSQRRLTQQVRLKSRLTLQIFFGLLVSKEETTERRKCTKHINLNGGTSDEDVLQFRHVWGFFGARDT